MDITLDIAVLANAIVWPMLIGILVVYYRQQIGQFLKEVTPNISRVSLGPIAFDLNNTKGFEPSWTVPGAPGGTDLRHTAIIGDQAKELFAQIEKTSTFDYAVFDLGTDWLSSRLYLFVKILTRLQQLRCIVFVDSKNQVNHHFVGFAEPCKVVYSLARLYPWLERSFARSYSGIPSLTVTSGFGALEEGQIENLINNFLWDMEIQQATPPEPIGWIYLPSSQKYEHADWITGFKLEAILDGVLSKSFVKEADLAGKSKNEQVKSIIFCEGKFVAVVGYDGHFVQLIDRLELAEKVARSMMIR
jgi:hypothetical protein